MMDNPGVAVAAVVPVRVGTDGHGWPSVTTEPHSRAYVPLEGPCMPSATLVANQFLRGRVHAWQKTFGRAGTQ